MSTVPISSSSIYQELQAYFQQRGSDVRQLGNDLAANNIAKAQQDFNALQTTGPEWPVPRVMYLKAKSASRTGTPSVRRSSRAI